MLLQTNPFETYNLLDRIRRDAPDVFMTLAPLGTKPMALGCVPVCNRERGCSRCLPSTQGVCQLNNPSKLAILAL